MTVTRDLVKDLLPLYVAGEASPDSRAAVESFLATDPELARLAEALRSDSPPSAAEAPPAPDRFALSATKQLVARRSWTLALALFFTGLPFAFSFDGSGLQFLLIRDAPSTGVVSFALGGLCWVLFALAAKRLRVKGL